MCASWDLVNRPRGNRVTCRVPSRVSSLCSNTVSARSEFAAMRADCSAKTASWAGERLIYLGDAPEGDSRSHVAARVAAHAIRTTKRLVPAYPLSWLLERILPTCETAVLLSTGPLAAGVLAVGPLAAGVFARAPWPLPFGSGVSRRRLLRRRSSRESPRATARSSKLSGRWSAA